jgi:hypothetical protein
MSKGWRFCQRIFAIEYAKIGPMQGAMNNEMLKMFLLSTKGRMI